MKRAEPVVIRLAVLFVALLASLTLVVWRQSRALGPSGGWRGASASVWWRRRGGLH